MSQLGNTASCWAERLPCHVPNCPARFRRLYERMVLSNSLTSISPSPSLSGDAHVKVIYQQYFCAYPCCCPFGGLRATRNHANFVRKPTMFETSTSSERDCSTTGETISTAHITGTFQKGSKDPSSIATTTGLDRSGRLNMKGGAQAV